MSLKNFPIVQVGGHRLMGTEGRLAELKAAGFEPCTRGEHEDAVRWGGKDVICGECGRIMSFEDRHFGCKHGATTRAAQLRRKS